jgi:radical SAM-linked protein
MKRERLFFLRRMNAWSPRTPLPPRRPHGGSRTSPRPATDSQQKEPSRFRLRYSKLGPAAFQAHLDLVRHLPRAFRRAGLEIYYSIGFHPKPGLIFGPALGLGIPSLGELLDVKLVGDMTAEEVLQRLAPVCPPGIDFLAAAGLVAGDAPLGRVLSQAHYAARLPPGYSADAAVARWKDGQPLLATRRERHDSRRPDRGNAVDVRKSVVFVSTVDSAEAGELQRAVGWSAGEDSVLRFGVVVSSNGSARPVEVLDALLGEGASANCAIVRTGLFAGCASDPVDPLCTSALAEERAKVSADRPA